MTDAQRDALERLIAHAHRDSGQSKSVANFLLAWWNAPRLGGFDLTEIWGVDDEIAADMVTVFEFVASTRFYPDSLGYESQFRKIVDEWR